MVWGSSARSALIAIALMCSGLVALGAGPAHAGPGYQQPRVGQCRALTYAQSRAASNTSRAISCASRHTAQTIGVSKLPKKLTWKSPAAKVNAAMGKACTKAFAAKVGQTTGARQLSAYTWVGFKPTKSQRRHGARWFRCDALMPQSGALAALTRSTAPMLISPTPAAHALCLDSSSRRTTCDRTHTFKATSAFALSLKKWPGLTKVRALAAAGCDTRVSTASYRYLAPSQASWSYSKWVTCFSVHPIAPPPPPPPPPPPDPDTTPPSGTVLGPDSVPFGSPVMLSGEADDEVAVESVALSVRTTTGSYLQDDGSFATTPNTLAITETGGASGTAHLTWERSLGTSLPIAAYTVAATVTDTSGNSTNLAAAFAVDALPDTLVPTVSLLSPDTDLATSDGVVISGLATDDVAVTEVTVQWRNGAGQYLQDNLTTYATTVNDLPVTVLGMGTVEAQYDVDAGTQPAGAYTVRVTAADPSGNRKVVNRSVTIADTSTVQVVDYQMNEPAEATVMTDSGSNHLNGVISQLDIDTGVEYDGAIGYSWIYKHPESYPPVPERIITVPDNVLLDNVTDSLTIEMRYRTTHSFGNIAQKGQSTTAGGQWKIQAPGGYPSCLFKSSIGQMAVKSTLDLSDGAWHTLRCIRTATAVRMYVDDVYQGVKNSPVPLGPINNNFPLTVGGKLDCDQIDVTCDYFTGQIDYLRLTHE